MVTAALQQLIINSLNDSTIKVLPRFITQETKTFPCVTIQKLDEEESGNLCDVETLALAWYQVDTWCHAPLDAMKCAKTIKDSLRGFRGVVTDIHADVPDMEMFVRFKKEVELVEKPLQGSDKWIYRVAQRYTVRYRDA
jgi:hypothetical protein